MFTNIFYDYRQSIIHLWEEKEGKRTYSKKRWVPYVFQKTDRSGIHTIVGDPVKKVSFNSYNDYYAFCKNREDIYENKVKPDIQFLAEKYHTIPDDEIETPSLVSYTIDIEVAGGEGFPDTDKADQPVVLISIKNSKFGS